MEEGYNSHKVNNSMVHKHTCPGSSTWLELGSPFSYFHAGRELKEHFRPGGNAAGVRPFRGCVHLLTKEGRLPVLVGTLVFALHFSSFNADEPYCVKMIFLNKKPIVQCCYKQAMNCHCLFISSSIFCKLSRL